MSNAPDARASELKRLLIIWGNWGPYHFARYNALRRAGSDAEWDVRGWQIYGRSAHYAWETDGAAPEGWRSFDPGVPEPAFPARGLLRQILPELRRLRPDVVLVPSYWHWSLILNGAARLRGARIVMMNESHGGTEQARGWKKKLKRAIVSRFHAGFVGGSPHRRHFDSLGLPAAKTILGYDAIDNAFFQTRAEAARADPERIRSERALPPRYLLNLGRFVAKKNLGVLIRAFALLRDRDALRGHDLVLVGSGEEESILRQTAAECGLPVLGPVAPDDPPGPAVRFYGFRQIDENPDFYALATAFVLPSLYEEWGLVINEAMAAGLPVVVSETAGCAEDLVEDGKNGFRFDPASPEQLADKLALILASPETSAAMARASRERIASWGLDRFASGALEAAAIALKVGK